MKFINAVLASLLVSQCLADTQDLAEISCSSKKCVDKTSPPYVEMVDRYSLYAAKCCSLTPFPGSVPGNPGCGDLYVSAFDTDGETCMLHGTLTFDEARAICVAQGARLCTSAENLLDCTRNAKCGLNAKKVWSGGENIPSVAPSPAPTKKEPTPPGGHDDPHLYTWKGIRYGYHGECDLVYTTCPNFAGGKGLNIHLRTKMVEPLNWSTIAGMAVKIGDDVLEVQNNGEYYLNGELNADLTSTSLAGYMLTKEDPAEVKHTISSIFTVELEDGLAIEITRSNYYGRRDMISFKIEGVHNHRMSGGDLLSDCVGLTSSWDHSEEGEILVGRSGATYTTKDAVDFGPEWQVDLTKGDPMLFAENLGQQLPDQECIESPLQARDGRHLRKLMTADNGAFARQAEEACSHLNGDDLFDACFFDVLVTGDASFAEQPWYNGN